MIEPPTINDKALSPAEIMAPSSVAVIAVSSTESPTPPMTFITLYAAKCHLQRQRVEPRLWPTENRSPPHRPRQLHLRRKHGGS
ncbi:unnamed protein product [Linum trigynum]|uniref:Uncharacterized protein n=1 Tax=Linum trigynum TaxID=586398 RepID=A0AAV2CDG6_9ROSI